MDNQNKTIRGWNSLLCAACIQIDSDLNHRDILENILEHNQQKVSRSTLESTEKMLITVNNRLYHNYILSARCRLELAYLKGKLVVEDV
jgi:hypothetical protein